MNLRRYHAYGIRAGVDGKVTDLVCPIGILAGSINLPCKNGVAVLGSIHKSLRDIISVKYNKQIWQSRRDGTNKHLLP